MINSTLVLQMVHFFIAYLILKYILFRPALQIIHVQEERLLQVNHDIVLLKNTVAQEHARQKQQQIAWAHKALHLKPEFGRFETVSFPVVSTMYSALSADEQEKIVKTSVQQVVAMMNISLSHKKEKL